MLCVLGEALIDLVAERDGRFVAHSGGSPFNVAVGLARLGQPTAFMARLSDDIFGRQLRAHVETNGVNTDSSVPASEPTTLAVVSLDAQGRAEYQFYVDGTADWQWTDDELAGVPGDLSIFHTGSIASWTEPGGSRIVAAARRLREQGVLISYDPNARPRLMGSAADAVRTVEATVAVAHIVKCSDEDLAFLYPDRSVDDVIAQWLALGPELVVVTLGSEGAAGATRAGVQVRRKSVPITLADTIGAGDAFMSGLLASLSTRAVRTADDLARMSREQLEDVVDDAVLTAALTCERSGADQPTAAEFAAARAERQGRQA